MQEALTGINNIVAKLAVDNDDCSKGIAGIEAITAALIQACSDSPAPARGMLNRLLLSLF